MTPIQVLLAFYGGTVILNLLIAAIQYSGDRSRVQRNLLFYWLGILASAFGNSFMKEVGFTMGLVSATGTFVSQLILASFFTEVRQAKLRIAPLVLFYLGMAALAYILARGGVAIEAYGMALVVGATWPMFASFSAILKTHTRPFTLVQKMFLGTAVFMSIHYLDWPLTILRPDLQLPGFGLAFALVHLLSVLAAMMANESMLQDRNEHLEQEVDARARQLTEANKMASLGRMAGGIAHEINNPLQIISLKIQGLQRKSKGSALPPEETVLVAEEVLKVIARITRVTDSLRKVARDKSGAEKQNAELRQIVEETLDFCTDRMEGLAISFRADLPKEQCLIFCHATEIAQIILNLLNNAIDAVEPKEIKEISLSLSRKDRIYELAVEDSGYLDPAVVPRVMDPFFTTKPVGQGTGLGLSISKTFAEAHGGKLYLDPAAPRTRFVLELPAL